MTDNDNDANLQGFNAQQARGAQESLTRFLQTNLPSYVLTNGWSQNPHHQARDQAATSAILMPSLDVWVDLNGAMIPHSNFHSMISPLRIAYVGNEMAHYCRTVDDYYHLRYGDMIARLNASDLSQVSGIGIHSSWIGVHDGYKCVSAPLILDIMLMFQNYSPQATASSLFSTVIEMMRLPITYAPLGIEYISVILQSLLAPVIFAECLILNDPSIPDDILSKLKEWIREGIISPQLAIFAATACPVLIARMGIALNSRNPSVHAAAHAALQVLQKDYQDISQSTFLYSSQTPLVISRWITRSSSHGKTLFIIRNGIAVNKFMCKRFMNSDVSFYEVTYNADSIGLSDLMNQQIMFLYHATIKGDGPATFVRGMTSFPAINITQALTDAICDFVDPNVNPTRDFEEFLSANNRIKCVRSYVEHISRPRQTTNDP